MSTYRERHAFAVAAANRETQKRYAERLHRLAGHSFDGEAVVMPNDEFTLKTCEIRDPVCCLWAVASIRWTREGPYLACFSCANHSVRNRGATLLSHREGVKIV